MSYKLFDMMILFLTLMIIGSVTASPVDYSTKRIENPFMNIILESMNKNSFNNHTYRSGTLLRVHKISAEGDPPVVKISVLLERDCIEEPLCPQEICNMLITQDKYNNIIIDDKLKECDDVDDQMNFIHVDERSKREATEVDVKDPIVKRLMNVGSTDYYNEYKNAGKPFMTKMVNATKEDTSDGTKYVIYFNIVEPTCIEEKSRKACFMDDFSPTRLCVINVENTDTVNITKSKITSSCENEPTASI